MSKAKFSILCDIFMVRNWKSLLGVPLLSPTFHFIFWSRPNSRRELTGKASLVVFCNGSIFFCFVLFCFVLFCFVFFGNLAVMKVTSQPITTGKSWTKNSHSIPKHWNQRKQNRCVSPNNFTMAHFLTKAMRPDRINEDYRNYVI